MCVYIYIYTILVPCKLTSPHVFMIRWQAPAGWQVSCFYAAWAA